MGTNQRDRMGRFVKGHDVNLGRKSTAEKRKKLSDAHIGKYPSEETRRKMSESHRGKPCLEETKRKISAAQKGSKGNNWHKHPSKETREKLSEASRRNFSDKLKQWGKERIGTHRSKETRDKTSGAKNPNWKGGITKENRRIRVSVEFRLWREAVFARDNWTCQKTGIKGGKLHPHHIKNFADSPELRFAVDNGITLSDKAHKEFHKRYGVRNNTKEQLEEFLGFTTV